jgi:hypothetical protein
MLATTRGKVLPELERLRPEGLEGPRPRVQNGVADAPEHEIRLGHRGERRLGGVAR